MSLYKSLLLLCLGHLFVDFAVGVWPIYKTLAGMNLATAGIIASACGFIGEGTQLFFGIFSDKGYRKFVLMLGILLACSAFFLPSLTLEMCWMSVLMVMLGSGAFHPAGMGMTSKLSAEKKRTFILLFAAAGALGLGSSQLTFSTLYSFLNDRVFLLLIIPFLLLGFIFYHRFHYTETGGQRPSLKEIFQPVLLQKKSLFLLYIAQIGNQSLMLSFSFLLPDLMHAKKAAKWLSLGGGHLCCVMSGAIVLLLISPFIHKVNQKKFLLMTLLVAALSFFLFLETLSVSSLLSSLLLITLGGSLGIINPLIVSWGHELLPTHPSTVSALLMGCAFCIANLSSVYAGFLTTCFSEDPLTKTFYILGAFFLFLFIPIGFLPKQSEKSIVV